MAQGQLPYGAFSNWPRFEQELRAHLDDCLGVEAANRVMLKTQRAYAALQLPGLVGSLDLIEAARLVRFESWNHDFRASQEKMLATLIASFVSLET